MLDQPRHPKVFPLPRRLSTKKLRTSAIPLLSYVDPDTKDNTVLVPQGLGIRDAARSPPPFDTHPQPENINIYTGIVNSGIDRRARRSRRTKAFGSCTDAVKPYGRDLVSWVLVELGVGLRPTFSSMRARRLGQVTFTGKRCDARYCFLI